MERTARRPIESRLCPTGSPPRPRGGVRSVSRRIALMKSPSMAGLRTLLLGSGVVLVFGFAAMAGDRGPSDVLRFHHENVLGTSMELKVTGVTETEAARAEGAVLAEIDRLAGVLSTYDPESEASRWLRSAGEPVVVSPELFEVLETFDRWRLRSGGALDPAAEAACAVWRTAAAQGRLPDEAGLSAVVRAMSGIHWRLEPSRRTASRVGSTPIRLNSLAKGFILERAVAAALAEISPAGIVLGIGGDLVVRGSVPESVSVVDPRDDSEGARPLERLRITDRAVATSGTYRRGVAIGGQWYSHIVDPRTGRPVSEIASATVVSPSATDAGALATSLCVLTPEESLRIVETVPEAECLLVARDGRQWRSPGWHRWQMTESPTSLGAGVGVGVFGATKSEMGGRPGTTGAGAWDSAFELAIQLELARIDDPRYRRPFVAVWVEDQDKVPVRTVALWFHGPRWLPDLRSWYKGDQLRLLADPTDLTSTASSATRPPGRYSLKWDGKDDAGVPVKSGKYTVFVEVAREHGTYQLIRHEMTFPAKSGRVVLQGNPEVASVSLEYRRRTEGR